MGMQLMPRDAWLGLSRRCTVRHGSENISACGCSSRLVFVLAPYQQMRIFEAAILHNPCVLAAGVGAASRLQSACRAVG